jgi:glycine oxidase
VFDVAVIGNGIIGLSAALELARAGASCALIGASEPGGGSGAAAGILAPSAGERDPEIRGFFRHSLGLFPNLVGSLREFDPTLALLEGLLEIVSSPASAAVDGESLQLDASEVGSREPALRAPFGALFHPRDGAIDSERLLAAMRRAASQSPHITVVDANGAARIDVSQSPAVVTTRNGGTISARTIVLAAGAWSPRIEGLPRALPVVPVKGQIIALDAANALRRPVMGDGVYLVPRGAELVVGATSENAGFDVTTDDVTARSLHAAAAELCPALAPAPVVRRWAGLRPATPDLLPILGPDPEYPSLVYACGHSRNGILLAPATAQAVRAFCEGSRQAHSAIERLSVGRLAGRDANLRGKTA